MKNLKEDDADLCVFDLESDTQQITRVHHHDGLLCLCMLTGKQCKPSWKIFVEKIIQNIMEIKIETKLE
jgi:hypothetical protein